MLRRITAVVGLSAAGLAIAACTSSGSIAPAPTPTASADPALARFYAQHLTWAPCSQPFECTQLTVPLDYAHPDAATIELSVVRLPTSEKSARLGSLVLNPGGPGGSGVDYAKAAPDVIDAAVRRRFDIVGFDPRGVGASAPVRCLTDAQTDLFTAVDGTPHTAAQVAKVVAVSKMFADGCAARSPQLVGRIGTVDAARDVDVLRAALGEPKLNWFGASYGTFLGATYADLFPTKVGRMVLDGAIDPTLSNDALSLGQAQGFDVALGRFVDGCDRQSDCPLPRGHAAGLARIQAFFASLDTRSLPTGAGRPLTQALAMGAVLSYLYFPPDDWEQLRYGLTDAFAGNGSTLLSMLDDRQERDSRGHYRSNFGDALYAVNVLDRTDRPALAETQTLATDWAKRAPVFGAFLAWGQLPYAYWHATATDTAHAITAAGSPPILVVGTTYDPATPYPWAQSLARQLSRGVLLTRIGDGHTAYGMGSTCIDRAVDAYLTTGVPPVNGTVCRAD